MRKVRKGWRDMNRVSVKCEYRKPERVFDMIYENNGDIFIEMKFPGSSRIEKIKMNYYLTELGIGLSDKVKN
jgi:hypothetical protein